MKERLLEIEDVLKESALDSGSALRKTSKAENDGRNHDHYIADCVDLTFVAKEILKYLDKNKDN